MQIDEFTVLAKRYGYVAVEDGATIHLCTRDSKDKLESRWALGEAQLAAYDERSMAKELAIMASMEKGDLSGAAEMALGEDD